MSEVGAPVSPKINPQRLINADERVKTESRASKAEEGFQKNAEKAELTHDGRAAPEAVQTCEADEVHIASEEKAEQSESFLKVQGNDQQ
jgi:hypothetical protein